MVAWTGKAWKVHARRAPERKETEPEAGKPRWVQGNSCLLCVVRLVTFKEIAEIKEEEFGARNVDVMDIQKECAREDQVRGLKKMKHKHL